MSGEIKVASIYGKGSSFSFNLKLIKSNKNLEQTISTAIITNKSPRIVSASPKKILIAEDNLINQKLIKAILSTTDFYSMIVSDGAQVLTELNNQKFDLILMDINMPILDGLQASKQIRELEINNNEHIPIIALSAEAESDCMGLLEQFGIDNYLPKPINRQDLINLLNAYLS
jgi:CheY-like chemotaxis protein